MDTWTHFSGSLLGLQPQRFKVTTNSNHKFEVYLNLAARLKLSGINQLGVNRRRVARDTNPPDSKRFTHMRMLRRKYSRNKFESEF